MKTMLLACLGTQRRPRVIPREAWEWAMNWARRWWKVKAESAAAARIVIAANEEPGVTIYTSAGRIVDCGRHGPGATSSGLRRARRPR